MNKYMVIYFAPKGSWKMEEKSDEDMQKGMEEWMKWSERCGEDLLDMGSPLGNGKKVTPDGASNSENTVAGYSMLQAEDMDGALKLLENHPHLAWHAGCEIEVFELLPMPK